MKLEIISPEKVYFKGEIEWITLPGALGPFQILKNHAPLISSLTRGQIILSSDGHIKDLNISDGFVEVNNNNIIVCIDSVYK